MFSGIVYYRGTVSDNRRNGGGTTLSILCEGVAIEQPAAKDSIAISGVCLTATRVDGDVVTFDVVPETLARSTLGALEPGNVVNVEYALRLGDRVGGHFVYGHVDATARIVSIVDEGQGKRMRIERPASLAPALVEKAFVSIDGVSLTIAAADRDWFEIALIPETLARTTLGLRGEGDRINIEIDPVARYARSDSR
jgi:riboflavin synthase